MNSRLLIVLLDLVALLMPGTALAQPTACSPMDVGACADAMIYSVYHALAAWGWWVDRALLSAAFSMDVFRWWLIEITLTSVYSMVVQVVTPFLAPFALIALLLACLLFLLLPITGRIQGISFRNAMLWIVIGPVLLVSSGPLVAQLEQLRVGMSGLLSSAITSIVGAATTPVFGASASDMADPTALYPANPCGTGVLDRHVPGANIIRMDDLAAATLWATAGDIHCPEATPPGTDIPDAFYIAAPGGPGFATNTDIGAISDPTLRRTAVDNMRNGAIRTWSGILPCILAILASAVDLIFGLSLAALWLSLPIGMLFGFFDPQGSSTVGTIVRRMIGMLQTSWAASIFMGLFGTGLYASAQLKNAAAYNGIAMAGCCMVGYLVVIAGQTFKGNLLTISSALQAGAGGLSFANVIGGGIGAAQETLAGAGKAASNAAGYGWELGSTYQGAMHETNNLSYSVAAALGRIRAVANVGEALQTMGIIDDQDIAAGLYTGARGDRSLHAMRRAFKTDADRVGTDGLTVRERGRADTAQRAIDQAERPTILEELGQAGQAASNAIEYVGSAAMAEDLWNASEIVPQALRNGFKRMRHATAELSPAVDDETSSHHRVQRVAAAIRVADQTLRTGGARENQSMHLDAAGRVVKAALTGALPESAMITDKKNANAARLLAKGYTVADLGDGNMAFWKSTTDGKTSDPRRKSNDEMVILTQSGAVKDATAVRQVSSARATAPRNTDTTAADGKTAANKDTTSTEQAEPIGAVTSQQLPVNVAPVDAAKILDESANAPKTDADPQTDDGADAVIGQQAEVGTTPVDAANVLDEPTDLQGAESEAGNTNTTAPPPASIAVLGETPNGRASIDRAADQTDSVATEVVPGLPQTTSGLPTTQVTLSEAEQGDRGGTQPINAGNPATATTAKVQADGPAVPTVADSALPATHVISGEVGPLERVNQLIEPTIALPAQTMYQSSFIQVPDQEPTTSLSEAVTPILPTSIAQSAVQVEAIPNASTYKQQSYSIAAEPGIPQSLPTAVVQPPDQFNVMSTTVERGYQVEVHPNESGIVMSSTQPTDQPLPVVPSTPVQTELDRMHPLPVVPAQLTDEPLRVEVARQPSNYAESVAGEPGSQQQHDPVATGLRVQTTGAMPNQRTDQAEIAPQGALSDQLEAHPSGQSAISLPQPSTNQARSTDPYAPVPAEESVQPISDMANAPVRPEQVEVVPSVPPIPATPDASVRPPTGAGEGVPNQTAKPAPVQHKHTGQTGAAPASAAIRTASLPGQPESTAGRAVLHSAGEHPTPVSEQLRQTPTPQSAPTPLNVASKADSQHPVPPMGAPHSRTSDSVREETNG